MKKLILLLLIIPLVSLGQSISEGSKPSYADLEYPSRSEKESKFVYGNNVTILNSLDIKLEAGNLSITDSFLNGELGVSESKKISFILIDQNIIFLEAPLLIISVEYEVFSTRENKLLKNNANIYLTDYELVDFITSFDIVNKYRNESDFSWSWPPNENFDGMRMEITNRTAYLNIPKNSANEYIQSSNFFNNNLINKYSESIDGKINVIFDKKKIKLLSKFLSKIPVTYILDEEGNVLNIFSN